MDDCTHDYPVRNGRCLECEPLDSAEPIEAELMKMREENQRLKKALHGIRGAAGAFDIGLIGRNIVYEMADDALKECKNED